MDIQRIQRKEDLVAAVKAAGGLSFFRGRVRGMSVEEGLDGAAGLRGVRGGRLDFPAWEWAGEAIRGKRLVCGWLVGGRVALLMRDWLADLCNWRRNGLSKTATERWAEAGAGRGLSEGDRAVLEYVAAHGTAGMEELRGALGSLARKAGEGLDDVVRRLGMRTELAIVDNRASGMGGVGFLGEVRVALMDEYWGDVLAAGAGGRSPEESFGRFFAHLRKTFPGVAAREWVWFLGRGGEGYAWGQVRAGEGAEDVEGREGDEGGGFYGGKYGDEAIPPPSRPVTPKAPREKVLGGERYLPGSWQGGGGGGDGVGADAVPGWTPGSRWPYRNRAWGPWGQGGGGASGWQTLMPPSKATAERFYKLAVEMRDRVDDYSYPGGFSHYFPVYDDMTAEQKRGYFSWRGAFRRGEARPTPTSFVYVHVYELLMLVGVASPEEGLAALERIREAYADKAMEKNLAQWVRDFAVYYGVEGERKAEIFAGLDAEDKYRVALADPAGCGDEALWGAVDCFSGYDIWRSAFFSENRKRARSVLAAAYRAVDVRYRAQGRRPLSWLMPEEPVEYPCWLFGNAVFHDWKAYKDYTYEVNPARVYHCRNGRWSMEAMGRWQAPVRSRALAELAREVDRQLREAYGFGRQLKKTIADPVVEEAVRGAVQLFVEAEREAARPVVRIDATRLEAIRRDAEVTRQRLMEGEDGAVEDGEKGEEGQGNSEKIGLDAAPDEAEGAAARWPSIPLARPAPPPPPTPAGAANPPFVPPFGLTDAELEFIRLLVAGADAEAAAFLRGRHLFASAVMDSVNEKLLPVLDDVAVEEDESGRPRLVPDYRDALAARLSAAKEL